MTKNEFKIQAALNILRCNTSHRAEDVAGYVQELAWRMEDTGEVEFSGYTEEEGDGR